MIDRRFPTALQMMQSLALAEMSGRPWVTSAEFAQGLGANPTLVRRLLSTLVQSGLLISQVGRNGGVRLARCPVQISLRDVYVASLSGKPLWKSRPGLPHHCVISANFPRYFAELADEADKTLLHMLSGHTLAQSVERIVGMNDNCVSNAPDAEPSVADVPGVKDFSLV
jgi:Rrf2 family transcriptional regulator, repressor of oqxAB